MTTAAGSAPWDLFGYFADHRAEVLRLLWSHTWLSVLPVLLGLLVALPVGWLARRGSTRALSASPLRWKS